MCVLNEQIKFRFHVLLMILIGLNKSVLSFSDGVPLSVCSDLENIHGVAPQPPPYPFYTFPNKKEVTHGDSVQLTLSVKLRQFGLITFKGYLLIAINDENIPIGTFVEPSNGRTITCPNGVTTDNAVTHHWSDEKQFVQVYWIPPEDFTGTVNFRTTYLQNGTVFWVNVPASYPVRVVELSTTSATWTTEVPATLPAVAKTTSSIEDDENDIAITTVADCNSTTEDDSSTSTQTTSEELTTTRKSPSNASLSKTRLDVVVLLASLACLLAITGSSP